MRSRLLILLVVPLLMLCSLFVFAGIGAPSAGAIENGSEINNDICSRAQGANPTFCQQTNGETVTGSKGIILRAARLITIMTGIASVIMVIVGGIRYIFSAGDSNAIKAAKDTIIYALVGLVISMIAGGIVVFVLNALKS